MRSFVVLYFLLVIICGFSSCADDTEVGYGLLGSEDLEVVFTDDFDITMRHVAPTPFNLSFTQFNTLGTLDNPTFGKFSSSFYVRPVLGNTTAIPDFVGATLDSAVLALKVDTARYYGNSQALYDIEVFELIESIDNIDSFYSDGIFMTDPTALGSVSRLVPSKIDSIETFDPLGDTTYFSDVITIPLNRRFAGKIFLDTLRNDDRVEFTSIFDGLYVRSTSNNSLLQIDLANEISSLLFYYKDSSGLRLSYPYRFSSDAPLNFQYDLTGSTIEAVISEPNPELFYLQGHAGTLIEIDVEDVNKMVDPFINHASIEIFAEKQGIIDTSFFPLPLALDLLRTTEDGSLISTIDLSIGQDQGQTRGIFDGELEVDEENEIIKYEMNITTHIKAILEGTQSSKLFIAVRNRTQTPNNLIIYGPNHPTYPARLKLTHTKS